MQSMHSQSWSPYTVGAAIGGLETVAMLTAKKPLGITTVFENLAVMTAEKIAPEALNIEAYKKESGHTPQIDWQTGLVAGVVLGSFYSSRISEDLKPSLLSKWCRRTKYTPRRGYAAAAAGGALMMFGARMAKGCTSGHGISGTMQFSAASWAFTPIMFVAATAVTNILLGRRQ
jgi:uncharacterized protein